MKQLLFWYLFTGALFAQQLTLNQIMQGDDFIGHSPTNARWSTDGNTIFFEWNPNQYPLAETYFWSKGMTTPQKYNGNQAETYLGNAAKDASGNLYYTKEGALFTYHLSSKKARKYTKVVNQFQMLHLVILPELFISNKTNNCFSGTKIPISCCKSPIFNLGKLLKKLPKPVIYKNNKKSYLP